MSMKIKMALAGLAGLVGFSSTTQAADAKIGVDFASSYVFRGFTISDAWVAQPYMEVTGFPNDIGLTLGAWSNYDLESDSTGAYESGQFSEIDLYASYELPLGVEAFSTAIGYTEYTFPNSQGRVIRGATPEEDTVEGVDADREANLIFAWDVPSSPELGIYYGVGGVLKNSLYLEGGLSHEEVFENGLTGSAGATLGYASQDEGPDGFAHLTLDASVGYKWLAAKVYWIIETDSEVIEVDKEFVGVLGAEYRF